jgi:hypothetical protein
MSEKSNLNLSFNQESFYHNDPESYVNEVIVYQQFDDFNSRQESSSRRLLHPTVVRHDIRLSYALMFTNAINSEDIRIIYGFLDTYFAGNVLQESSKHNLATKQTFSVVIDGLIPTARFWHSLGQTKADAVSLFFDSKVYTSTDQRRNRIVSNYSFTATQIYNLFSNHPLQQKVVYQCGNDAIFSSVCSGVEESINDIVALEIEENRRQNTPKRSRNLNSSPSSSSSTSNWRKFGSKNASNIFHTQSQINQIADSLRNVTQHLPLLQSPIFINALGNLVMHTDENHRITRMQFEKTYLESTIANFDVADFMNCV